MTGERAAGGGGGGWQSVAKNRGVQRHPRALLLFRYPPALETAALCILGLFVGCCGTLIGLGGGFILLPVLVLVYPDKPAQSIAAISLGMVVFNALSGTIAYARMGRVDYHAGIAFIIASLPGAAIGALSTGGVSRALFEVIVGCVLVSMAAFLIFRSFWRPPPKEGWPVPRNLRWYVIGCGVSFVVGFLASFLGLGGGIVHVPLLIYALGFAPHRATATSHFVLTVTAFVGTCVHASNGHLDGGWAAMLALGVGAVIGAQIGARLSDKISGPWLVRGLAGALILVGVRVGWAGMRELNKPVAPNPAKSPEANRPGA